jgi:hypothetical protein
MAKAPFTQSAGRQCLDCLAGLILFAGSAQAQYDPDWSSHFRVGAVVGLNIKADFSSTGRTTANPAHPAGTYDDGYVHPTQNAQGLTGYWGYENQSQSPTLTQSILMHDTVSTTTPSVSGTEDGKVFPGFELAYGGNLWYWGRARIGWDFGFGLLPINITVNESGTGSFDQLVYSFNIPNTVTIPQAPYHGPASGQGAQIANTASATNTVHDPSAPFTGSQTLDVMLYTFRLGPTVYWDFSRYVGMSVGAGPALGLVSGDLKYDEKTGTLNSKGQVSGTDVVYGGYVNAMVMIHVVRNGDIYFGAQYMPLGKATISGDGRQARLDLSGGVYVSAGLNWPF